MYSFNLNNKQRSNPQVFNQIVSFKNTHNIITSIDIFTPINYINIANSLIKIINDLGIKCNIHNRPPNKTDIDECYKDKGKFLFIFIKFNKKNEFDILNISQLNYLPNEKYFLYQLTELNRTYIIEKNIINLINNSKHTFDILENNLEYYPNPIKCKISNLPLPIVDRFLNNITFENKTIDVLLCSNDITQKNNITQKMIKVFNNLKIFGINIIICENISEVEIRSLIGNSKIVLYITDDDDNNILEFNYLHESIMSNNTHIISEKSIYDDLNLFYNERINFINIIDENFNYNEFIELIKKLLNLNKEYYYDIINYNNSIKKNIDMFFNYYLYEDNNINVVLSGDKNVYIGICIAINSIIKNCKNIDKLKIYVICESYDINDMINNLCKKYLIYENEYNSISDRIDLNSKTIIKIIVPKVDIINYIQNNMSYNVNNINICNYNHKHTFQFPTSIFNFIRFYFHKILPDNVNKIVYIDSDMVINGDIEELFNMVPSTFDIGGVFSIIPCSLPISNWIHDSNIINDYNFKHNILWNAGMFVTFLNKWRVIPFTQICLNLINQNKIKKIYEGGTQSVMNLVFRNIFSIPQEWNQTGLGELPNKNYYKPDFENSIKNSKILHWTGKYKPWLNPINNEDFSIYWYKYT